MGPAGLVRAALHPSTLSPAEILMRLFGLVTLALASTLAAQSCGTLAFTGTGAAGTTLDIAVTGGTANGFCMIAVSENTGSTPVQLPFGGGTLTLGLASPIIPLPFGRLDANGDRTRSISVPTRATTAHNLQGQAVTLSFSFRPFAFSACASNVAAFTIGG